ncbi:DUF2059 domain-containing protein [Flavobacterium cellulosilyticum]|uniref:DUF2059 domain-containing protein n=1 Tax=Flavobacterium cellulosilyticum TaxID=2541731 RepID=A0A4R5C5L1_9FLAO|nr:DUF2059 domain-containing protein [Flavobacterium cellulosilyticum]TDD94948.1 DUF2059 domain-containing protein [Flavobacterium cellulosilyticum]
MKKLILVIMICIPSLMGYSQTKKQESIKELFHVMQQDSIMDKTFSAMIPMMMNQMKSQDPMINNRSEELMKATMQKAKAILKKLIDEDMVAVYDKYFSQKEINDYISFYKSKSGQKYIKVTPDISKDFMSIMMEKYMPEIQKMIQDKSEEIKNSEKK